LNRGKRALSQTFETIEAEELMSNALQEINWNNTDVSAKES